MPFFTVDEFAKLSQAKAGNKSLKGMLNEAKASFKLASQVSIFLSHSHSDASLIEQTISFLKAMNVNIYIDWLDETMSGKPSGATAIKLKSKIISSDKFLFLATNAAVVSKWCNWEVGIGDVFKLSADKICILPLADNRGTWIGNEYLQIYPRIEPVIKSGDTFYDSIFKVIYPDGTSVWLHDWLSK